MKALKIALFLSGMLPIVAQGQNNSMGNWLMYFGTNKVSDQFSIHTEVQYRNHTIEPVNIEQLLLRTGLNYHFNKSAFVTAGYGHISNYGWKDNIKGASATEHRIWQQFIVNNVLGRVKLEHRYRVEQRWITNSITTNYKNRLRYRIMMFVPLNKSKIEPKTWFVGLYDEIFMNTEQTFFDRNRLYGAIGYQLNKTTSFQAGMLHQQVNTVGKWHLQFAVLFNPDFRKEK